MSINDITNTTCITPQCGRIAVQNIGRGLCMMCYSSAKKLVESGATTWTRLEEIGMVLRKHDLFIAAFNKDNSKREPTRDTLHPEGL